MTAYDAYRTARVLADHGLDSDSAAHADIDAAADHAGGRRPDGPDGPDDRDAIRIALDALDT